MVTVTLHPFGHVLLPQIGPFRAPTGILREPFVIEFVHHEQPVAVAKSVKVFAVRIVRATYVVEAKLLQQPYALLDGAWKGRRPKHSECVMVGNALQEHFLSVEQQPTVGCDFNRTHPERFAHTVGQPPVGTINGDLSCI